MFVCLSRHILIVNLMQNYILTYFHLFRLNHSIYIRADIVKKTMMTLLKSNYMPEKMR